MRRTSAWVSALLATAIAGGVTLADESKRADPAYGQVVAATAGMVGDAEAQRLAARYGLQVMNEYCSQSTNAQDRGQGAYAGLMPTRLRRAVIR